MNDWRIFRGDKKPHDDIASGRLPPPPPWRDFNFDSEHEKRGWTYQPDQRDIDIVNAALYLRRPLLITGTPGTGKSSLIYCVARELKLGSVLRWPISSRSNLQEGKYQYDSLMHLRDVNRESLISRHRQVTAEDHEGEPITSGTADNGLERTVWDRPESIGRYIRLGPLGTAFIGGQDRPRALLIDEIDKSDIDLPNDLLHVFEEGEFEIPELARIAHEARRVKVFSFDRGTSVEEVEIADGRVRCQHFPFVILTSNGERTLPPAFLRRCLRLDIEDPDKSRLTKIVDAHLNISHDKTVDSLIDDFLKRRDNGELLATDQLLNAVFLLTRERTPSMDERERILKIVVKELGTR